MKCKHWRRKLGILEYFLVVAVLFFTAQTIVIVWSIYSSRVATVEKVEEPHYHNVLPESTVQPTGPCYRNVSLNGNRNVSILLEQIAGHPDWTWMANRLQHLWSSWQPHIKDLQLGTYPQKRVLVVPGLLIGTDFALNSSIHSGGPLGDLVQWADLILALHILGHRVTLMRDIYVAARGIRYDHFTEKFTVGCPSQPYDLVYTDIITVKALPPDVIEKARCEIRVLDAYGTEAMYNDKDYALKHHFLSPYGQLNLNLKQFYTFYPHTPDNTFLGFAVVPAKPLPVPAHKENWGLLYGKKQDYFTRHRDYIEYLLQYMEVHSTIGGNSSTLPAAVHQHGVLSARKYRELLQKSKFLIGFGEPLESTGVMEALNHGCIFLNPRFHGNDTSKLQHMGKPTSRKLTSQVPYLESIGEPHVFTVSMHNRTEVHRAITSAKEVPSFIPHLFHVKTFIERVQWLIQNQRICQDKSREEEREYNYKEREEVTAVQGLYGESCSKACRTKGLVCDPSLFSVLSMDMFKPSCKKIETSTDDSIYFPARTKQGKCLQPQSNRLFSCAGEQEVLQRLCACRQHNSLVDP